MRQELKFSPNIACKKNQTLENYEIPDSDVDSDIPDEHLDGLSHNEYTRRYNLNLRSLTWSKDSQGLFDYETRQFDKDKFETDKPVMLVRNVNKCVVHELGYDIAKEYKKKAQRLVNVQKFRNHFIIEAADVQKLTEFTNQDERKKYMTKDVDNLYGEEGE